MDKHLLAILSELWVPDTLTRRLGLPEGPLRLRRAWPRSGAHLLLEYVGADGSLVPGQWWAEQTAAARALGRADGGDAALVPLDQALGVVGLQLRGADCRLPGLAPLLRGAGARLLVHQPGRRAVVRLVEQGQTVYAKVVRPERAGQVAAVGALAQELAGGVFATPRLLAFDGPAGVVRWSALPGVALHELPDGAALEAGARAAGRALRALHQAPPPEKVPEHGPVAEGEVLMRWVGLTSAYEPDLAATVAALAEGVRAALAATRGPFVTLHRDFYDKQILVDHDGQVGLLDFDTLALGEPALDLANVLVHLELRALQGLVSAADAARAQAALYAGYAPDPEVWAKVGVYAAATWLRLACVYSFRPRWRACVPALLQRTQALM